VTKDTRDLRDPSKFPDLSAQYREMPIVGSPPSFHEFVDMALANAIIPDYPKDELLSTTTRKEYREELEARAAEGDKYAQSLLDGKQWDEPTE